MKSIVRTPTVFGSRRAHRVILGIRACGLPIPSAAHAAQVALVGDAHVSSLAPESLPALVTHA